MITSLLIVAQFTGQLVTIAKQKTGNIYKYPAAIPRLDSKPINDGLCKRFFYRFTFIGIITYSPVIIIGLHQQYFIPYPDEFYNTAVADLAAIHTEIV